MDATTIIMLDCKMTNVDKTTTTWNLDKALTRQLSEEILQINLKKKNGAPGGPHSKIMITVLTLLKPLKYFWGIWEIHFVCSLCSFTRL